MGLKVIPEVICEISGTRSLVRLSEEKSDDIQITSLKSIWWKEI